MELECENPGPEEPCWGCRPCLVFILHEKDKELASLRAELGKLNDQWADSTRLAQEAIARAEKAEAALAAADELAEHVIAKLLYTDEYDAVLAGYLKARALRNASEATVASDAEVESIADAIMEQNSTLYTQLATRADDDGRKDES